MNKKKGGGENLRENMKIEKNGEYNFLRKYLPLTKSYKYVIHMIFKFTSPIFNRHAIYEEMKKTIYHLPSTIYYLPIYHLLPIYLSTYLPVRHPRNPRPASLPSTAGGRHSAPLAGPWRGRSW